MTNQDSTGKSTTCFSIEHILIKLVTAAMPHLMINKCIIIYHLILISNHATIAETLSTFSLEHQIETVASDTIMKCNHIMVHTAIGLLLDIHIADTTVLIMSLLQTIEIETGILTYVCLNDLSSEEVLIVSSMVTEEELCLSSLLQDNENATVYHQVNIRTKDIDNLYGTIQFYILWNIDEQAILCQECVQCSDTIFIRFCNLSIVFCDEFGIFCSNLAQRIHDNTLWQLHFWKSFIIESIVHYEVK